MRFTMVMLAALGGLIGCSGIDVTTDYNREWDYSGYKTYDWAAEKSPTLRDPLIETSLLERRVKRAVGQELGLKGYTQSADDPDFLIVYHVGQQSQVDVSACGYHYPTSPHCWGRDIDTYIYTEGTLILDFIDPAKDELVWRGSATRVLFDPEEVEETVNKAVRQMLKRFPPG